MFVYDIQLLIINSCRCYAFLDADSEESTEDEDDIDEIEVSLLESNSPIPGQEDEKYLSLAEETSIQQNNMDIGIFWDVENCPVPKNMSTAEFVGKIRQRFCSSGGRQLEFHALHNGKNERLNIELHELG